MKKNKVFAFAGVTLLAATFLAACSGSKDSKSASKKDTTYGYHAQLIFFVFLVEMGFHLVDDITHEPDYDRAIAALQQA